MTCSAGSAMPRVGCAVPAGSVGMILTPNVGQRGVARSARSKISIAKFDRTPPATGVVCSALLPSRTVTGSKNSAIELDAPHRVRDELLVGLEVQRPVVPRQPQQPAAGDVGRHHDELVTLIGLEVLIPPVRAELIAAGA